MVAPGSAANGDRISNEPYTTLLKPPVNGLHYDPLDDLLIRTSWTDAAVALNQIDKGKAGGQRTALWLRARLQAYLFALGCFLHRHAGKVLFVAILVLATFCVALKSASIHTRVEDLWVEEGGRLEKELRYVQKSLGEAAGSTHELLIQTPKDRGANLLHPQALLKHLEVVQAATSVTVHLFDTTWRLKDMCYSPNIPNFDVHYIDQIFENIIPCAIITPLDCFWEGSKVLGPDYPVIIPGVGSKVKWTNLNPLHLVNQMKTYNYAFPFNTLEDYLKRAGVSTGYQEKPCLNPRDPECPDTAPNKASGLEPDVSAELTGGCYGFAAKYMHWPEDVVVGGTKKNKTGHITKAHALQTVVQLMGERELYEFWSDTYKVHHVDWTQEKAAQVLDQWQKRFAEEVRKMKNMSHYNVHAFSTATLNQILSQFSELSYVKIAIGYGIMVVYVGIVLFRRRDSVRSQTGIGIAGVVLVAIAVAAALGFCALLGIAFNAATTQIIPFLALGLGMGNMFHLLHTYADAPPPVGHLEEQSGTVLKQSGLSVLISSLCMMCAFFAAALVPIPALRVFALQAAVLVLFNLGATLLVFPALVSLDLRRRRSRRPDIVCCWLPETAEQGGCDNKWPWQRDAAPENSSMEFSVKWVISRHYVPVLMRPSVKVLSMLVLATVLTISVWGLLRVSDGLDLTDIVPQNTDEHAFLTAQSEFFGFYNMYAVTRGEFEYPTNQRLLYEYHEAFMRVPNVMKNDDGGLPDFWLIMFRDWLAGLQRAFDRDWARGAITQERWFPNASDEGILAYKLLVQTGHVDNPIDKSLVWQVKLVDSYGIINPKAFYNYLSAWSWNDALAYGASQANLRPEPRQWYHSANDFELKIPKSAPLVYTQLPFYLTGLRGTEQITDLIAQVRAICQRFEERGLPNFPSGIPFLFWEQYLGLRQSLACALLAALAAIFVLSAILLLNLWAAVLVVLSLASIVLQLLGLMGVFGVKLSAIPAVLLIVAVGIGVNFSVHICLGFVTAVGGKNRRVQLALEKMASPVLHAAVTTLLAVTMLAFSQFDFIVRYFFYVLVALLGTGLLNGLVFFPVLLSVVGPAAEVRGTAHRDRIAPPSPPVSHHPPPTPPHHHHHHHHRNNNRRGGPNSGSSRGNAGLHAEPSLTTITEEPGSWHSSHSVQSIVVQPELVVQTTTYDDRTSHEENTRTPRGHQVTTKVTATAKVKVEVHTPSVHSSSSSSSRSGSKGRRDSSSSDGSSPRSSPVSTSS